MPVDVTPLKRFKLGKTTGVLHQHTGIIHELCQPDHAPLVHQRHQILRRQPRAGCLHMGRGHAGRQVHPKIHHQLRGCLQKVADPRHPADIRNLMRIADRCRYPPRGNAAVELVRCDQRAFHMQMRVDEAGHQHPAGNVDFPHAAIVAEHANNGISADRHIGFHKVAGDQIEHPPPLEHQIGRLQATTLIDSFRKGRFRHGILLSDQGT